LPSARRRAALTLLFCTDMLPRTNFCFFAARKLILGLVLLICAALTPAQNTTIAPLSAPTQPQSLADFIAAADEVLAQMSKITGLELRSPLKKSLRSRDQIRAYVIKQMSEDRTPAERYADARSGEALGLIPKGFDTDKFLVNVLTEQIEGLYDPKTHEFFIADWSPPEDQRMVMAHELTHALQDQHFQIEGWARAARPNDDAELAREAFLEGSATAAMVDYMMLPMGRSLKDLPDFDASVFVSDQADTPTLKKAPPFLKDALLFPYLHGLNFSSAVLRGSGWASLPAIFARPPASTQQILHPELYKSGKIAPTIAVPDLGGILGEKWVKIDENLVGEFGWNEILKQFLDVERGKSLAAAWDGDRYVLYEQKDTKKLLLAIRIHLDSAEHAARFFGQYSEALEKKHAERESLFRRPAFFSFESPDGGVYLRCLAEECVTLEGATREQFDAFTKLLEWPAAPLPAVHRSPELQKTAAVKLSERMVTQNASGEVAEFFLEPRD
jgi:hypothetical protein